MHGLVRAGDAEAIDARVVQHTGDLADGSRLAALVAGLRPHVIVNLGGLTSVGASWQDPVLTAEVTGLAAVRSQHAVVEYLALILLDPG